MWEVALAFVLECYGSRNTWKNQENIRKWKKHQNNARKRKDV
jgi:hypothetical protein